MKCPGQDSRFWKADAIFEVKCPNCGTTIEFFKDDTRRRCPGCGENIPNPEMDFGCAAYCPYAEHCLGGLPDGVTGDSKLKILKGKMFKEIKKRLGSDSKKVAVAVRFLELSEDIGKKEGVKLGPVLLTAFSIGILDLLNKEVALENRLDLNALEKTFNGLGAEVEAIEESISLLKQLPEANQEALSNELKVIMDAKRIATAEAASGITQEITRDLLTDSAVQMIKNKLLG